MRGEGFEDDKINDQPAISYNLHGRTNVYGSPMKQHQLISSLIISV